VKQESGRAVHSGHNIISLHLNAEFYLQRGMQSLDRYRYDKALRYFRRAVETEPYNAVHHINLAGVLSETGDYESSNEILTHVLESLDPNLTECYFYLANNYMNMDMLEQSEQALLKYLELDEEGFYLEDAEEMLEILSMELGRPVKVRSIRARQALFEHEQARMMLEEGKFSEAVLLLESLTRRHPGFMAARNNLALAYYYRGEMDKALQTVHDVLEDDPGNLHALCNLTIFMHQMDRHAEAAVLTDRLAKLYPLHHEQLFKLATTMGIIGRHDHAYRLFKRLLRTVPPEPDASMYHYAAVAAVHLGKYEEARRLWLKVRNLDERPDIANYYLRRLNEVLERGWSQETVFSYNYQLPFEEQLKWLQAGERTLAAQRRLDPVVRSSFFWVLRHGQHDAKLQVIKALGLIGDDEVEMALREFVRNPDEPEDLKDAARSVLAGLAAERSGAEKGAGRVEPLNSLVRSSLPTWDQSWQDVVEIALSHMEKRYGMTERYDMQALWADFLRRMYPWTPRIRRPEGWSAALEYLIAKMHSRRITYLDVATRYGISTSTVRRHVAAIDEACGLREKMGTVFSDFGGRI